MDRLWVEAETRPMRQGAMIFRTGTKAAFAYRLVSGRADIFGGHTGRNPLPLYHVSAGDYLIEAAFGAIHDTSATCTTPGEFQRIQVAKFRYLIQDDAILAQALFRKLARDIAELRHSCQHRGQHVAPLRERILTYVAKHADPASRTLELPYSLTQWAKELGVANETLSRVLRQLQFDGLLERPTTRTFHYKAHVTAW